MKMKTIKPTLGRVLWYTPQKVDGMSSIPAAYNGKCTALIVDVLSDDRVNLVVHDKNGKSRPQLNVHLVQEGEDVPESGGYAEWMPYQLGQAAKTEEVIESVEQVKQEAKSENTQPPVEDNRDDQSSEDAEGLDAEKISDATDESQAEDGSDSANTDEEDKADPEGTGLDPDVAA